MTSDDAPSSPQGGPPLRGWLVVHGPETALLILGIALRLLLHATFHPRWGYDAMQRIGYVYDIAVHGRIPPLSLNYAAYHPPLYYVLGSLILRAGGDLADLQWLSIGSGVARLVVFAWLLRRYLPMAHLARTLAMAVAAVLPAALHTDGMVSNEPWSMLVSTTTLGALALLLETEGRARWRRAILLGLLLAVCLLSKQTGFALVVLTLVAAVLRMWWRQPAPIPARLHAATPLALAAALGLAIAVPVYAIRARQVHTGWMDTGYEIDPVVKDRFGAIRDVPLWRRRPPAFFLGPGSGHVLSAPFYPTDVDRFWPTLLASTFVDYYNYRFSGWAGPGVEAEVQVNAQGLPLGVVGLARRSLWGGIPIALVAAAGLLGALVAGWRRRDLVTVALMMAPLLALAGQASFALKYAIDTTGPVKGAYLQFAAAPLYAAFGLGVAWLAARRGPARLLAALPIVGLLLVAMYSIDARTGAFREQIPPAAITTPAP